MTDKTIYPICHLHPVQCAQSAWIRGGIMIWICLLAAGSAQYLIHHRFFFFLLTFLPTYCTFIVVFLLVISCLMLYAVHGSEMALTRYH